MKLVLIALSSLMLYGTFATPVFAQSRISQAQFCQYWQNVCTRTGGIANVCAARHRVCQASGCYEFRNPGPRCYSNAVDVELTRGPGGRR